MTIVDDFGTIRGGDSWVERGHSDAGGLAGQDTTWTGLACLSARRGAVREASHHPTIPHSLQLQVVMVLSVKRGECANVHPDWLMHDCFSLCCNHLGSAISP